VPLIRWVFRRFARTYDLVTMPRREERALGRAQALRHLVEALGRAPVGLTPEAAGSGTLVEPRHGVGLFFILLSRGGCPVLPAGIWEENSSLVVRFGEPFHLSVDPLLSREEQDRAGRDEVMIAIGKLLPRPSWGAYEQRIADALADAPEETRR
jgi:hypothetical protein